MNTDCNESIMVPKKAQRIAPASLRGSARAPMRNPPKTTKALRVTAREGAGKPIR